ncbi:hypothetical protein [uncultured Cohaesibacter sp.]|uniref:hypothetical protein n=1 Tax=uncultured Cohaesibacter sp. TaxID=1002546 RepID=UPI00293141A4|nr:hypothetical protein [uncultured Cohaesibacter sp.]
MNILKTSVCTACILATSIAVTCAEDLSFTDRIEQGWYISTGLSPTVMGLYPDNGDMADAISNTFYGIEGSVEVCKAGVGSADWLDVCGGGTGFISLGDATKASSVAGVSTNSKSSMTSFGGYVKARAHAGNFVIAPYGGVRQINLDVDVTVPAASTSVNASEDITAAFGGAELGVNLFKERATLALKAEAGRTISGTKGTYASVGPVLRISF